MEVAIVTRSSSAERTSPTGQRLRRERIAEDIVVAISSQRIRRKWLEILGDLFTPEKRHMFQQFKYAPEIEKIWRENFRDAWIAVERGEMSNNDAWRAVMSPGIVYDGLPLEQSGAKHVTETWVWGREEMKRLGLAFVEDLLTTEDYVNKLPRVREVGVVDGGIITENVNRLNTAEIGLDPSDIARYRDQSIEIPVDHSLVLSQNLVVAK